MASNPPAGAPQPPPQPVPPAPAPADSSVPEIQANSEERQMAMVAHLGGVLPFVGWMVPLALWAMRMGESPFIEDQAKEALNLQINILMITVVATFTCFIYIGWLLVPVVVIGNGFYCFLGAKAAKEGKVWRYPYNVRYIN